MLSEKMAADPFAKIKKIIDDMITKLLEEANADAEKEGFCDKELGMNKITREKLSKTIDSLTAAVEDGKATIMELTEEMATLNKEISELQGSITEATKMRQEEKEKNEATVDDAVKAQKAVEAATSVLKDFYEKAGKATAFVQLSSTRESEEGIKMGSDEWKALGESEFDKGHQEGDATFGDKFQGQQEEAGGVLALLEVILSDFANVETDTKASEAASQKAFEDFKIEAKKNIAMKDRKVEMDNSDKVDTESKLREDVADLKSTQDELLAADRYYEKLVPQCLDKGPSYEEKKAAREKEIQSLKTALDIISSQ
jgi:regulator of replication initiation timing